MMISVTADGEDLLRHVDVSEPADIGSNTSLDGYTGQTVRS
jgi:hypothetical protein